MRLIYIAIIIACATIGRAGNILDGERFNPVRGAVLNMDFNRHGESPWTDKSGNGKHGTVHGATWVDSGSNELGRAYDFDGTDYISSTFNALADLGSGDPFSFSCWVYVDSFPMTYTSILSCSDSNPDRFHYVINVNNRPFVGLGSAYNFFNTLTIPTGIWTFTAFTFDGSVGKFYVNNDYEEHTFGSVVYPSDVLLIGKTQSESWTPDVKLTKVRIYDSALTSNQVYNLSQHTAPTNAMVAFYDFEGNDSPTITDSSPEKNDGQVVGAALVNGGGPDGSGCMSFDGNDDYISIDDADEFSFNDKPFTLMAWVNMDDASDFNILSKYRIGTEWVFYFSTTDKLRLLLSDGGANFTLRDSTQTFTSHQGKWLHIAVTCPSGGDLANIKMYANGESITMGTAMSAITMVNTSQKVEIGRRAGTLYANGSFDDPQIYDRVLTAHEIMNIYTTKGKRNL